MTKKTVQRVIIVEGNKSINKKRRKNGVTLKQLFFDDLSEIFFQSFTIEILQKFISYYFCVVLEILNSFFCALMWRGSKMLFGCALDPIMKWNGDSLESSSECLSCQNILRFLWPFSPSFNSSHSETRENVNISYWSFTFKN